jgi:succinate dehydrogenase/fumarate reductase flavoprotein subunit
MTNAKFDRRQLLAGAGVATAALAASAVSAARPAPAAPAAKWDYETDVLCVGSGAAACSAAIAAIDNGAKAMLVEKMPLTGGTTGKSGGVCWIPNNSAMRAAGLEDKKEDCMRYMARYAHPLAYNPDSPTLGLTTRNYKLLEAFYDNGAKTIDRLAELGATKFKEFRLFNLDLDAPDYADHLPENKRSTRRTLEPAVGAGSSGGGNSLAAQLAEYLEKKGAPILTDTRVCRILVENGRVIGVEACQGEKTIRIKANRGVVFGSGGYAHNVDLVEQHQISLYGACAMPGSTGDFIEMAQEIGAKMGPLGTAWRTQVVLGEALENRAIGLGAFVLPGDSMIVVNKYGNRCVNEKRDYNDRTQAHFHYDPSKEEYTNHLQFMLFDQRSIDAFGGDFPFPKQKGEQPHLIEGNSWDEVFAGIEKQIDAWKGRTGGVVLDAGFAANAKAAIARFNGYAKAGADPEFDRGLHLYDREWHKLFSMRNLDSKQPENKYPNITMHPIADKGPFYAIVLAPGALDTSGGPLIDERAQVLGRGDKPIPGLYGAGNCIAAPTRTAYLGAGGTIGPALTFGFIAGSNAAKDNAA